MPPPTTSRGHLLHLPPGPAPRRPSSGTSTSTESFLQGAIQRISGPSPPSPRGIRGQGCLSTGDAQPRARSPQAALPAEIAVSILPSHPRGPASPAQSVPSAFPWRLPPLPPKPHLHLTPSPRPERLSIPASSASPPGATRVSTASDPQWSCSPHPHWSSLPPSHPLPWPVRLDLPSTGVQVPPSPPLQPLPSPLRVHTPSFPASRGSLLHDQGRPGPDRASPGHPASCGIPSPSHPHLVSATTLEAARTSQSSHRLFCLPAMARPSRGYR